MKTFAIVLASAYLVLGGASAQGSSCSGDIKVSTQDDLNRLKSCSTYQGNIVIDNVSVPTLELKGVQMLKGDLLVSNNNALTSFSTGNLQAIDGTLKLSNNKILSKLDISQLTALRSFEATVEPALSAISFTSGLSQVDRVQISDTTATAINGLKMQKLTDLLVDNNIYLKSLPISNLTDISGTLTISANSPDLNMDLSNLQSIKDASFRNLHGVALDKLEKVAGDLSFVSNTFSELGLGNINEIGGTLTITKNPNLEKLGLPKLKRLGGALSLGENSALASIQAFPNLEEVDGTLDITGSFDEVQLPKLNDVRGGLNVQTSSNKFSCNDMSKLKNGVIKGNSFLCKASVAQPKSGLTGKNGANADSSADSGAAAAVTNAPLTTIAISGILVYLLSSMMFMAY